MADSHPWQERINRRLSTIGELQDGWLDGQGDRIDSDAIEAARQMLCTLAVASLAIPEIKAPGGIFPTADGGVGLEWHVNGGWLAIEFTADGRIEATSASAVDKTARFGFIDEDVVTTRPQPSGPTS